jgi:hypothetical protein
MSQLPADWREQSQPPAATRPAVVRSPLEVWLGGVRAGEAELAAPLKFHLWELMVTITVAAVLLALFRALGIVGAALAFFAALIFTNVVYPRFSSPARQAAMFDLVWGGLMPLVCLTFDPFVFKYGDTPMLHEEFGGPTPSLFRTATVHPWSWPVYAIIGWQVACLAVWLVVGRLPAALAGFWAGMLWAGFGLASIVGVLLLLPSTAGAIMGIGFLGYTPLFTARTFYRRALIAGELARREAHGRAEWLLHFGFMAAVIIPGALGGMLGLWLSSLHSVR